MNPDFKLVNITDSSLEDISSSTTVPVLQGATNNTYQVFSQTGGLNNNILTYNIQIPSLSTCVNRELLFRTTIVFQINLTQGNIDGAGSTLYQYGNLNSLQAFPFNSLISTAKLQINDTTIVVNTQDIKAPLLKLMNYEDLQKWNGLTPAMPDSFYQNYIQGIYSKSNILSNFSNSSYDKSYQPRGVFPVKLQTYSTAGVLADAGYTIQSLAANAPTPFRYILLTCEVVEPLLFLSPLIYSAKPSNNADFLGINNLVIELTLNNANRCLSNASTTTIGTAVNTPTVSSVSLYAINKAEVLMQFKSIPPTLASKISPKNVLDFCNFVSYPLISNTAICGVKQTPPLAYPTTQTVQFNNVQLNQIPSKILIYARPTNSTLTSYDSDFFFSITGINITFCNKSGLLSGCSQQQLYQMSVRNLLQETYYEFLGSGVSATEANATIINVPTIGSILCIDPALDLGLDLEYSNGSSGQFNITFSVNIVNQTATQYDSFNVYMIVQNTGLFITENGKSTTYLGLLNKESVLETKSKNAIVDSVTYKEEIVGGNISNNGSVHKHLKLNFKDASEKEEQMEEPHQIDGSAMSAGSLSGGAMSAGSMHHHHMHHKKMGINRFHH